MVTFQINGMKVGSSKLPSSSQKGFVAFGTSGFFPAQFDNFSVA